VDPALEAVSPESFGGSALWRALGAVRDAIRNARLFGANAAAARVNRVWKEPV